MTAWAAASLVKTYTMLPSTAIRWPEPSPTMMFSSSATANVRDLTSPAKSPLPVIFTVAVPMAALLVYSTSRNGCTMSPPTVKALPLTRFETTNSGRLGPSAQLWLAIGRIVRQFVDTAVSDTSSRKSVWSTPLAVRPWNLITCSPGCRTMSASVRARTSSPLTPSSGWTISPSIVTV